MPEPLRSGQRYMPGLDGLRALAVFAVIAYHLGLGWASGGLLGVGVFFTLSGYLITDLLLGQLDEQRLRLADFWMRRARRLLPGLFLMLVVVAVWVWIADRSQLPGVRAQVAAAVVFMNNWWQISQHLSYFARFGPRSPSRSSSTFCGRGCCCSACTSSRSAGGRSASALGSPA